MVDVYWLGHNDEFEPSMSSLTRVTFNKIRVDLDTSQHYIEV